MSYLPNHHPVTKALRYLRQPMPWPRWILCLLLGHRWDDWQEMRPGKRDLLYRCCDRCETPMFIDGRTRNGKVMRPSRRAVILQWLCACRPGGHPFGDWYKLRRRTDVKAGTHTITQGHQCDACGLFQTDTYTRKLL